MQNTLEQLNRSALKFLVPLTPQATYKTIVKEAIKLVNAHYGSLTLEELVRFMWDNPSVFESFLQKYIITRLIDGIYERDEDRKLAAALYNSTLEGGVPIEEYPGYLDEHSVTTVLKNVADDSGNPGLLRGLRALKLL